MRISNYNSQFFKLDSSALINDIIANPGDYQSIEVQGNINCCDCPTDYIIDLTDLTDQWLIDLTGAVTYGTAITAMNFQNKFTGTSFNPFATSPIDLTYIGTNCGSPPCTLQTFNSHYQPLIKSGIDTYFTGIGIASDVTVTISGNVVTISDIPTGFLPSNAVYTNSGTNVTVPFTYSSLTNIYLTILADGIYISPALFNQVTMVDGIYKFTITATKSDVVTTEFNCAFIDVTFKCKLATYLQGLLTENGDDSVNAEKISTTAHLLHYGLTNGSNCGCNCTDLCTLFTSLNDILINTGSQITNDCGC